MTNKIEKLIIDFKNSGAGQNINYYDCSKTIISSHSTKIEGSTLTIREAYNLIKDGIAPKRLLLHSVMTIDHYNAIGYVIDQSSRKIPISIEQIKHINSLVMKGTGQIFENILKTVNATKEDFRKASVIVGSARFMNYDKVPTKVTELVNKINQALKKEDRLTICQKLELSFFAHYELVNIHPFLDDNDRTSSILMKYIQNYDLPLSIVYTIYPFLDGNGRTARLLMDYIQNYFSLPLSTVCAEDNREYYQVLSRVRNTNNIQPFYDFMFSQYEKYLDEAIEKANEVDKSKSITFNKRMKENIYNTEEKLL